MNLVKKFWKSEYKMDVFVILLIVGFYFLFNSLPLPS